MTADEVTHIIPFVPHKTVEKFFHLRCLVFSGRRIVMMLAWIQEVVEQSCHAHSQS